MPARTSAGPSPSTARERPEPSDPEPIPPDGYEVVERAGEGRFCRIWKVRETADGQPGALKQLKPECRDDPAVGNLLVNEARAAGAAGSRYVVAIMGCDHDGGSPYNLLEWIDGQTLEARLAEQEAGARSQGSGIRSERGMAAGEAVWIARQCAQGLADLAGAGFAHGDVKPENILIGPSGEVTLIDLGFARRLDEGQGEPGSLAEPLPMTGTPEYLAPERLARAGNSPAAADMYSLGITLYRMLAGTLPFAAPKAETVLRLQRSARPPSLREYRLDLPPRLIELIQRLLAKQPVRRPHSYDALVRELVSLEVATLPGRFEMPETMAG